MRMNFFDLRLLAVIGLYCIAEAKVGYDGTAGRFIGRQLDCDAYHVGYICEKSIIHACKSDDGMCSLGRKAEWRDFGNGPKCFCYTPQEAEMFVNASKGVRHEDLEQRRAINADAECSYKGQWVALDKSSPTFLLLTFPRRSEEEQKEENYCSCFPGFNGSSCQNMVLTPCEENSDCGQYSTCTHGFCVRKSLDLSCIAAAVKKDQKKNTDILCDGDGSSFTPFFQIFAVLLWFSLGFCCTYIFN